MTTITVKGTKFNVERVAQEALELANSGTVGAGSRNLEEAAKTTNPVETERKMILAQCIYRTMKYKWAPRWDRVNENDLVETILQANKNRVKRLRRNFR